MKTVEKVLLKLVRRTTLCFTLLVMTFAVVGSIAGVEASGKGLAISQLVSFFVFSLLLGVSFGIADFVKNSAVLRRTVQFVLTYASLVLVFFTGNLFKEYLSEMQNPAFSVLAISFIFVVIYTVISLLVLLAGYIYGKVTNSSKEYESMFEAQKNLK